MNKFSSIAVVSKDRFDIVASQSLITGTKI